MLSYYEENIAHSDSLHFTELYDELTKLARHQLRRLKPGDTIDTIALVHEAYLKLTKSSSSEWADKTHFIATAARAMRQILVDSARKNKADKRGGAIIHTNLHSIDLNLEEPHEQRVELLDLEYALTKLFSLNKRQGRVIELRFFGGLAIEEIAKILSIGPRTVDRDLFKAKAFLYRTLLESDSSC